MIKSTVFSHFCGGESIDNCDGTIGRLAKYGVQTILDYSLEGEKSEKGFDATVEETIRTIVKSKGSDHMPFCVFKPTGVGSAVLMEKVQHGNDLTEEEKSSFERIKQRYDKICKAGYEAGTPILIDAEETWYQDTVDDLVYAMMRKYNGERVMVFNTFQMYRTESLGNLKKAHQDADAGNYFFGAKLVRGAYMEKERDRAGEMGYPSPIHSTKPDTDNAFDDALTYCVENIDRISVMCGSHNDQSNYHLTKLLKQHRLEQDDIRVWFAQLFGMSDHISFNLAQAGYNVVKYVPYGPVKSVMPYLFRRAEENTSVAGQSSRELTLIRRELQRRKQTKQG
jgi:proline dehydrogenase